MLFILASFESLVRDDGVPYILWINLSSFSELSTFGSDLFGPELRKDSFRLVDKISMISFLDDL